MFPNKAASTPVSLLVGQLLYEPDFDVLIHAADVQLVDLTLHPNDFLCRIHGTAEYLHKYSFLSLSFSFPKY